MYASVGGRRLSNELGLESGVMKMTMINLIKKVAKDAIEASNPVSILYGEVLESDPLKILVDQRFTLTKSFLIQTDSTTELSLTINGAQYTLRPPLQAGDKVVLVRMQGGQKYLVLDKVVST